MGATREDAERLSQEECLLLLAGGTLGRVAFSTGALPSINPAAYRLLGDRVVIAVGASTDPLSTAHGNVIAFEADGCDPASRSRWTVLAVGVAARVPMNDPLLAGAGRLLPPSWSGRPAEALVMLRTDCLAGRRCALPLPLQEDKAAE